MARIVSSLPMASFNAGEYLFREARLANIFTSSRRGVGGDPGRRSADEMLLKVIGRGVCRRDGFDHERRQAHGQRARPQRVQYVDDES